MSSRWLNSTSAHPSQIFSINWAADGGSGTTSSGVIRKLASDEVVQKSPIQGNAGKSADSIQIASEFGNCLFRQSGHKDSGTDGFASL